MRALLVAVAALVVATAPAPAHAGACAPRGLDAQVLSHPADVIPVGGGVLVGWTMATGDGFERGVDPTVNAAWRFKQGKKKLKPVVVTLAPGLSVYQPPRLSKGKAHKLVLADGNGKKLGAFTRGKDRDAFLAGKPDVGEVVLTSSTSPRGGSFTGVTATLNAAVPEGAVALIVYEGDTAMTWSAVEPGSAQVNVYASPGRCGLHPPGTQAPYANQEVSFAWVDQFGRLSKRSAKIKVVAATP